MKNRIASFISFAAVILCLPAFLTFALSAESQADTSQTADTSGATISRTSPRQLRPISPTEMRNQVEAQIAKINQPVFPFSFGWDNVPTQMSAADLKEYRHDIELSRIFYECEIYTDLLSRRLDELADISRGLADMESAEIAVKIVKAALACSRTNHDLLLQASPRNLMLLQFARVVASYTDTQLSLKNSLETLEAHRTNLAKSQSLRKPQSLTNTRP